MTLNVAKELAALERMTVRELKQKFEEVFAEQARSGNKLWLIRRIIWRMQANAEGDLSERARQRAAELADDAEIRTTPPRQFTRTQAPAANGRDPRLPSPGTTLIRNYKGRTIQVDVKDDGFVWDGERYQSLSAVAKAITGSHMNGFRFFNLEAK